MSDTLSKIKKQIGYMSSDPKMHTILENVVSEVLKNKNIDAQGIVDALGIDNELADLTLKLAHGYLKEQERKLNVRVSKLSLPALPSTPPDEVHIDL